MLFALLVERPYMGCCLEISTTLINLSLCDVLAMLTKTPKLKMNLLKELKLYFARILHVIKRRRVYDLQNK